MARRRLLSSMVALIAAVGAQAVTLASAAGQANDVRIDVPVVLKDAKVVFTSIIPPSKATSRPA